MSNLDVDDLADLPPGAGPQTDQVLYNLSRRGPEYSLLPRCRELSIPVMAYSPVEQGRLLGHPALRDVSAAHGATPAQIALAWVMYQAHQRGQVGWRPSRTEDSMPLRAMW